jgi:hypothetical protein
MSSSALGSSALQDPAFLAEIVFVEDSEAPSLLPVWPFRPENSVFVGNPRGRRTAAILASLTSSCRRQEMDPQLYFMQLLMNLPSWPANGLEALLPDRGKQAHADSCTALEISPLDS